MARTALTPQALIGPYPAAGSVSAGQLVVTMTAADASNGNKFVSAGNEVIIAQNTDSGAHTITITSVADNLGRSADITSYSLAAGAIVAFNMAATLGWLQTDGNVYISANDATVKFAILKKS